MPRGRGGGKSNGISWAKKEEPKFIREFKERIAYKEKETIETKKKVLENDLVVEREEDRPQVVQLRSGDLNEDEYIKIKSKEEIENSASSFGKIVFKRPGKKTDTTSSSDQASGEAEQKRAELNLIFNLNSEGKEVEEPPVGSEAETEAAAAEQAIVAASKKKLLSDEDKEQAYGLQQPKKRFIDKQGDKKADALPAAKVLAREAKAGNKKLLSFYDEEQEEVEEFEKIKFAEKVRKLEEQEEDEESD